MQINSYINFWKKSFVYKERTNRREFLLPLITNGVIGALVFTIWFAYNYQNFIDVENPFFPFPTYFYVIILCFFIPTIAICIRRLNDIGKPWNRIFYLFIPIYRTWLSCLLLRPSKEKTFLLEEEENKPYFQRRKNSNYFLMRFFIILLPLSSYFFGIRQKSAELAFMPLGISTFITNLLTVIFSIFAPEEISILTFLNIIGYFAGSVTASYYAIKIARGNILLEK